MDTIILKIIYAPCASLLRNEDRCFVLRYDPAPDPKPFHIALFPDILEWGEAGKQLAPTHLKGFKMILVYRGHHHLLFSC